MDISVTKTIDFVCRLISAFGIIMFATSIAFFMAIARTKSKTGRIDWLEACMCSMTTVGIWSFLDKIDFSFFGYHLQEKAPIGLGVFIGYIGTNYIFGLIDRAIKKHLEKNSEDSENGASQ